LRMRFSTVLYTSILSREETADVRESVPKTRRANCDFLAI
jgi:hypothetical protein